MSAPVDVLAQEIRSIDGSHSMGAGRLAEALMPFIEREFVSRAAVAELIERDKVAAQVFDCILRGVNDLSGPMGHRSEQFVAGWLKSWAKSLHAAGFKPSDPTATDIARALARIGGAA